MRVISSLETVPFADSQYRVPVHHRRIESIIQCNGNSRRIKTDRQTNHTLDATTNGSTTLPPHVASSRPRMYPASKWGA